ncbi:MAG: hypothetical protein QOF42_3408 [Gammaproteobacteria bacterium]|jgi:uncharacterized protein YndB with AHSA1/START domain|nr:hypothetical protein [Gammaproteobacteria bacterium]
MIGDRARVSVAVAVPPSTAFAIFTEDIDRWWRRGLKYRHSASNSGLIRIEPQLHGRLFESFDADGGARVIEVGRIRAWEPPHRLAFSWRNANYAADEQTDVEVTFEPSSSGTLITVTHSGLASLRSDHPARHGQEGAAFSRMIGLWWGEQMSSLRQLCVAAS